METDAAIAIGAGWVDTHIHLLPGLDDGPASLEDALAMAEVAIADGTTHVVATSHANYQFTYSRERVAALRDEMQAILGERLRIGVGCELHLTYENVEAALQRPREFSLNASRYLLCEFPEFFERTAMGRVIGDFCRAGVVPVLAHPERNPVFQQNPGTLLEYLRLGGISQVTASSFTGRFGKRAQHFSVELLNRGWVHVVASDGHSAEKRPPHLTRAVAEIASRKGEAHARQLCSANPLAMMSDQDLAYAPSLSEVKKKGIWARLRS